MNGLPMIEQSGQESRVTDDNRTRVLSPDDPCCKAAEEGARARRAGVVASMANPYAIDTDKGLAWLAGWLRPGMYIGDEGLTRDSLSAIP